MTIADLRHSFREELGQYAPQEADIIFYTLLEKFFGWDRLRINQNLTENAEAELKEAAQAWLADLKEDIPLQYITGETTFYGMQLEVAPGVLIPRPETEELLYLTVQKIHNPSLALDVGTGSGCLALALKKAFPHCAVTAIDNSAEALKVAKRNSEKTGLRIDWRQVDLLQTDRLEEVYNLIISNPPYVSFSEMPKMEARVLDHEPHQALFPQGNDPLIFYRKIAELASVSLATDGLIALELNQYLAADIEKVYRDAGFKTALQRDMSGNWRFLWAQWP